MKIKNKPSPREIALSVLRDVENGSFLQETLDGYLEKNPLNKKDKALITALVYGYFRIKLRLLFILKNKIRGQFKKLPKKFLYPLCLGVYEILYMDKIPDYATVSFYVEYIKRKVDKKLVGLANGVLRNICREKELLLSEDFYRNNTKDEKEFFESFYSMPREILNLLLDQYDYEKAICFLQKSIHRPYLGIKINLKSEKSKDVIENFNSKRLYSIKFGSSIYGFEDSNLKKLDIWQDEGLISLKSIESQIILDKIKDLIVPPIWDVCCGVGGKLLFFLEEQKLPIWGSDIDIKKLKQVKKEIDRLNLQDTPIFVADGTRTPPLNIKPNTIILDVPCTGFGVLSRRPDIKYSFTKQRLNDIIDLQIKLVDNAISFLPENGILTYITCTWNKMENEEVIGSFIKKYKKLELVKEIDIDFCSNFKEFFYCAVLKKRG